MTKENMKRKEVKKMTVKTVSAIVVAITLVFTVLIATKGVANDNVIVPEKKPATLNLKAKAETVQNWLASRPDAVSTWVEDAKEYQEQQRPLAWAFMELSPRKCHWAHEQTKICTYQVATKLVCRFRKGGHFSSLFLTI